jgi:hypothetical protein
LAEKSLAFLYKANIRLSCAKNDQKPAGLITRGLQRSAKGLST